MDRVYESGASAIAPTPPAVPSTGFPSRGNPGTGTMPTVPGPYMMHSLVEEIMAVISAAGIAPDKAVLNQLKLALDSLYMSKNGTSALLQNFAGLTRSMTALGGGLVREYVDITNAATVGGIEIGVAYNCAINTATGVWAGRDIADICWLEKWHDVAGTKEFWFAPTAAAGVVPAWVNVFTLNTNNGNLSISGAMTATALNVSTLNGGQISGFRNKIINGDMRVSQVNGTAAVTPTANSYPIDQFAVSMTQPSKLTFQQVIDAPAGFKFSTKISVAAQYAPLATDYFQLYQPIEGQNIVDFKLGTAGAVTLATSNYIKGSVPGIYSVSIRNGAVNRSYTGTINVTTLWAPVVITLVGDTAGVWATDNSIGAIWMLDLGSGTNYNTPATNAWQAGNYLRTAGSVTFVNQIAGSTLNITGVQLESVPAGATSGTAFEYASYADQLRWCQRYLPCWNSAGAISVFGTGGFVSATGGWAVIPFPVPVRVPVTGVVVSSASHLSLGSVASFVASAVSSTGQGSATCSYIACTVAGATAGWSADIYFNNAAGQLYFTGAQM